MKAVLSRDNPVQTVRAFLDWAAEALAPCGTSSSRLDAELLLAGALGISREAIHMHPGRRLNSEERRVSAALIERRVRCEPVAYILGQKEFMGMDFAVDADVLIPRWETELLLERFEQWLAATSFPVPLRLLDLGTGSGNIAVCLARQYPESRITAVDVCEKALTVARNNAERHGVAERIRFVLSDWFADVEGEYHAILCNPPYIDTQRMQTLMPDVQDHEPARALDGGPQGLDAYRRLIPDAHSKLVAGGGLFFEIGEDQAQPVASLIESHGGYTTPQVIEDLSGCDRVVCTQRRNDG